MKQNIITHISSEKIRSVLKEIVDEIGLIDLNINEYEEFFHALMHFKPVMFIVEINNIDDPYLKITKIIKKSILTRDTPIIVVTNSLEEKIIDRIVELDVSHVIYFPILKSILKMDMINIIENQKFKNALETYQDIQTVQSVMISGLASLAEYRDPETGEHIKRTQNYVKALAITLKRKGIYSEELTDDNIETIYMSVPLHDIGKVGIRDNILLKQGRLTKEEFEIMKTHTTLGYEAIMNVGRKLKNSSFLEYAADVAYTHHEKYDGTGYPRGLKGDDIPLIGRLMAVADVYDALISKRIYKDPMTHDEAIEIIKSGRGSHFDPKIVDCALDLENTFQNIAQTYADFDPTMTIFDHDKMVELKNDGLLKKILIVEDSRIVRLIMKNQLLAIGFDVDEAENGEVGLKIATKNDYDLILLDIEMPKMNGYQMVTALKTVKELPIIIAMTAADYSITYGELKTFGIEGLILKPVDFNRLASKYTEILREQGKLEY